MNYAGGPGGPALVKLFASEPREKKFVNTQTARSGRFETANARPCTSTHRPPSGGNPLVRLFTRRSAPFKNTE